MRLNPGVRHTVMGATGRVGRYHWAEVPGEQADIRDVVRTMRTRLRGLSAVNVSWDSGKMQDLSDLPAGWFIQGEHAVSPPLEDDMMSDWPQSHANSGRYDEWYFFQSLPTELGLQPFCNWQGTSLQGAESLAFPGGFDLKAQLERTAPEVVIGDGTDLFVIAADESACLELREVEYKPHDA